MQACESHYSAQNKSAHKNSGILCVKVANHHCANASHLHHESTQKRATEGEMVATIAYEDQNNDEEGENEESVSNDWILNC